MKRKCLNPLSPLSQSGCYNANAPLGITQALSWRPAYPETNTSEKLIESPSRSGAWKCRKRNERYPHRPEDRFCNDDRQKQAGLTDDDMVDAQWNNQLDTPKDIIRS